MTILGKFYRRKDRERIMKVRTSASKRKLKNGGRSRELVPIQSSAGSWDTRNKAESSPLQISVETAQIIRLELLDLGVDRKSVSVAAVANALAGSRRVVSRHANGDSQNALLRITKQLKNLAFRRNKVENDALKRRYQIVSAFNRLEKSPDSSVKMISSWEEAKEALSSVISFPDDEEKEVKEAIAIGTTEEDLSKKFSKALEDTFRRNDVENLVPLTDKWKKVASYPSPIRLGSDKRDDQSQATAVEEADKLFALRVSSAAEALDEVIRSKAAKQLEERMRIAEQEAEAKKRASALMRPLNEEEKQRVNEAMHGIGPDDEQLASFGPDYVQRGSMQTLRPGCWLNDEVIHYFLTMLSVRDEELCKKDESRKRSHFFKSFFITKLLNEGHATLHGTYEYKNVKRWSKKAPGKDLFNLDKIFFPINQNQAHWLCACAFMSEKRIEIYDSMGSPGRHYLESIFQYLQDEHQAKKGSPLPNIEEWELVPCRDDVPQQRNCNDCGVFTCMFIDFLSKDCPLVFSQEHITQCRERIALSILNGKAIM